MLECSRSIFEPLFWRGVKNNGSCVRQHLNVQRGIDVIRNTGSVECFATQYISELDAIHFWGWCNTFPRLVQYISEGKCITFPWNVTNLATLASSDVDVHCDRRRVTRVVATCTLSTTFPSVNFHSNATFPPMQCISKFLHTINTVFNYICTLPATFASVHFHSDTNIAPMHFCSQTLHNVNLVWILYTWALPANRTAMHFHSKPTLASSFPNSL